MHAECMAELETKVKEIRKRRAAEFHRMGHSHLADYSHHGEMRGYYKILELISPNPFDDK